MWNGDRDGRREYYGLARALNASVAPAGVRAECQCTWYGPSRPVGDSPAATAAAVKGVLSLCPSGPRGLAPHLAALPKGPSCAVRTGW
jgi:hypothetical protein